MVRLVVFAKVFSGTVEASFHGGDGRIERFGNLRMAATFLHEREQSAVLWTQLFERVPQGIQLLGADSTGWLRDVFVFLPERQKYPAQLLAAQLVNAGIARQPKEPRLELGRCLQTVDRSYHLDENLLGQILHVIASIGHSVDEPRNAVLIGNNNVPLGVFVPFLSAANKVGQRGRCR
jgi:hypothetical protein